MQNTFSDSDHLPDFEAYVEQASAIELARRSLLGAPVYTVISLIILIGTPMLTDYGWWAAAEAVLLIFLGGIRVWFALDFPLRYERIKEKAVVQFSILTALQSLTLGVLAGLAIYDYWAAQEVVLTIVLSASVVAASTSALSVRKSAHAIFLVCVLGPFGIAIFLVGGPIKAILILGYLILMALLVQDGGRAKRTYIQRMKDYYDDQGKYMRLQGELRKLAQVVEQSPDSIMISDLDARIEYVNKAFLTNSGYTLDEVLGQNTSILQSKSTSRKTFSALWDALDHNLPWQGEFNNRRKDGSEYVEMAYILPLIQPDGTKTHYVAIMKDVTERQKLAQELAEHRENLEELVEERTRQLVQAQQRAEVSSLAKSTFLANMSHEIRTPMNAIVGFTHLLQRDDPRPDQEERLIKIDDASEHLMSIINGVLDLARIESGNLHLEYSNFHLGTIFDQIDSMLRDKIESRGMAFKLERVDMPLWLRGDVTRLRQAVLNYMGNAIKFTKQGAIILRASKLEERGDKMLIRFEVQDTGIGVKPKALPHLFEAFEQGDSPAARKYAGSGLGLAITKRLAEMMGGKAGAISVPGQGSTFWFTVWLRHGAEPVASSTGAENAEKMLRDQFSGSRILLVEDNLINSEVTTTLLVGSGLVVETAEDGAEAVAKVRANDYDLILMDIQMPVMNGLDATRLIRSMNNHADLPILAMTANVFEDDRQACIEVGMNDFVAKPVEPKSLFSMLVKWLSEKKLGDSISALD